VTPCWLQQHGLLEMPGRLVPVTLHPVLNACEGRRDPCHLVPKRLLRREFPHGLLRLVDDDPAAAFRAIGAAEPLGTEYVQRSLELLLRDPRIIVEGCRRHHGLLDVAKKLRIPRDRLPVGVEEFAEELGPAITAWLDTEYGVREVAA
jgi:hypothetical protein